MWPNDPDERSQKQRIARQWTYDRGLCGVLNMPIVPVEQRLSAKNIIRVIIEVTNVGEGNKTNIKRCGQAEDACHDPEVIFSLKCFYHVEVYSTSTSHGLDFVIRFEGGIVF